MKNQFLLLLCLMVNVFATAQITLTGPNLSDCNKYTLDYVGSYGPAYYPGEPAYPAGPGYSYFWYTSDGQTSTLQSPEFQFLDNTINVYLVLTPRKKPNHNKVSISQEFTNLTPTACPINFNSNAMPWTDHTPRVNDTMYLVIPLNRCEGETSYSGKVIGIQGMDYLDEVFEFPSISVTEVNSELHIDFPWPYPSQNKTEVVLKFAVTAEHDEHVVCEVVPTNPRDGDCNAGLAYNENAKGGPYDPNFLVPSYGTNMTDCDIGGDTIYYDLQFQNEGTGPTSLIWTFFNFDSKLDPTTFFLINTHTATVPVVGTHWYRPNVLHNVPLNIRNLSSYIHAGVDYSNSQICGFKCTNLTLTPMSTNYNNSIGYVRFGIAVRPGVVLEPCEELISTAEVIFNPMPGVKTNDAITSCQCPETSGVDCSDCPETTSCDEGFWCWVECCYKWIIGILALLLLWCISGKIRGVIRK